VRQACRKHIHRPWNYRLHVHRSATEPSLRLDQYPIPDMWQECHTMHISLRFSNVVAAPTSHGTYNFDEKNMPCTLPWIPSNYSNNKKTDKATCNIQCQQFFPFPYKLYRNLMFYLSTSLSFHYSLSYNFKIIKQVLKIMCFFYV